METEFATPPVAPEPATPRSPTVLAGVSGIISSEQVAERAALLQAQCAALGVRFTLACAGADTTTSVLNPDVDLATYPLPSHDGAPSPWAHTSATEVAMLRMATDAGAHATVVLHCDLAALTAPSLVALLQPVLSSNADLAIASYAAGPFDGLLNAAILAPLTRALYGRRASYPLAPDFAVSARLAARLGMSAGRTASAASAPILWPTLTAAAMDATVVEVPLSVAHPTSADDMELPAVIAQLVGSVFAEMETHAPLWQRVRPAVQPARVPTNGFAASQPESASGAAPIDTAPMINSFLLGSRSLQDVWGLILPPVTLLDLKRLTLLTPENFRMPDELWVRIVYDFALAYRLRSINRTHLLGALTPLYLGWVASYITEASSNPAFHSAERAERLARAFEEGKPYLVRRWRWPDRFNP